MEKSKPRYSAEKVKVSMSGQASLGWHLGMGYVQRLLTVKAKKWAVIDTSTGKRIAICSGKATATLITSSLNKEIEHA